MPDAFKETNKSSSLTEEMHHMLLYFSVSLRYQKGFISTTQPLFWYIALWELFPYILIQLLFIEEHLLSVRHYAKF